MMLPSGRVRARVREIELVGPDDADFPSLAGTPNELEERIVLTDIVHL